MTTAELFGPNEWDGVERRANGGKPNRVAVVFSREIARPRARYGAAPAGPGTPPNQGSASDGEASPGLDA